jgi:hypothetical protein
MSDLEEQASAELPETAGRAFFVELPSRWKGVSVELPAWMTEPFS